MAGFIDKARGGQQQAPAQQPAPAQDEMADSPENSEELERYKLAAEKMLFTPAAGKMILDQMKSGAKNPGRAIASATFNLMMGLDQKSGGKIPEDMLIPIAVHMLEKVAELAGETGVIKVGAKTVPQATQQLVAIAIENGLIDPEDIRAMSADMSDEEIAAIVAEQQQVASDDEQEEQPTQQPMQEGM